MTEINITIPSYIVMDKSMDKYTINICKLGKYRKKQRIVTI